MKRLNSLSLFRITIVVIINLYLSSIVVFVLSFIYLLMKSRREALLCILFILLIYISNIIVVDPIKIGYVESINNKYLVVNKIFYKERVYYNGYLNIGDIVLTNGSSTYCEKKELINNIKFNNYNQVQVIFNNHLYRYTMEKINNLEINDKLFTKVLLNEYIDENSFDFFFGYGNCIYYLLIYLFNKNKNISISFLIIYSIFFGFQTKFLLLLINYFLSFFKLSQINRLSIKVILVCIINYWLIYNYSISLNIIFSILSLFSMDNFFIFSMIQSIMFGNIQILNTFLFKYNITLKIILAILTLLCFIIPKSFIIFKFIYRIISYIFSVLNFSIKGKLNIFFIIIFCILYYSFESKIKNFVLYFLLILTLITPINNPFCHVTFIDVGQGDSILICNKFKKNCILIDTGSVYNYQKLKNFLDNEGIYKIDYLIVTHNDSDHCGNIENLRKDYRVESIIETNTDVLCSDIFLKNIYIGKKDNDNDNSLVYYTEIYNTSFLFTGDISKNIERKIVSKNLIENVDVLKVSHHGSKSGTSRELVSTYLPKYSIVSTNGMYNHPSIETINTLNNYLSKILITKEMGNVSFYLFPNFYFVSTDAGGIDIIMS